MTNNGVMDMFSVEYTRLQDARFERRIKEGEIPAKILLDFLSKHHVGKENAIKAAELARMFDDRNDRRVRSFISSFRNEGQLILSSTAGKHVGYYMAETLAEYEEFREYNFRSRALSILVTDRVLARAAKKKFGDEVELPLFDEEDEAPPVPEFPPGTRKTMYREVTAPDGNVWFEEYFE